MRISLSPAFADLTAATYTCKSNAYQTAWDALESVLTSNSYTYTGSGNYVTGVTDPAGCRLYAGDPAHGEWSGWMYTVNGKMPMLDATTYATLDKYLLQANDRIDFYYVNCPTESGDHDWTENTAKRQEPTCTADGSAFYSCSTCGGTKTEKLPATGHQYGEPAWTWIGYESASATFTCANDASHEETVAAAVTSAVTKEPTCTEDGLRTYTASVTFGEKNYTDTKTEGIKATGEHVWDNGVVTTEPTCTAKGVKTYTCTKCSATKTEELNALGHNYETKRTEPTCEKDGKEEEVCSRCGDVRFSRVLPATGHSYRWDPRTRRTVCENCGKILDEGGNTRPIIPANPGKTDKNFPFTDVSKNDGCYDAVDYLYSKGIMNGTSSTKFSPNGELTRAMVVTILYRAQGEPAVHTSGSFKDVAAGCYYTEAVEWAAANNIVKGFTDGTFKPDKSVTREQLAAFLSRFAQYNDAKIIEADGQLSTDAVVSGWARKNVEWAVAESILTSVQARNAVQNATRAEVAMAIYTYLTKIAK